MANSTSEYIDVAVKNSAADEEIGLRFPNTEAGQALATTLERRVRRGDLESAEVGKTVKGPKYDAAVAPERRRGRPVEGQVEAVTVVAVSADPADHDAEKLAAAEAESRAKLRDAEDAGETVNTEPGAAGRAPRKRSS